VLRPLTPKEKNVLEFIEDYIRQNGVAPSYLEIKEHFGFASFNSVQRYLKQLQQKKYIYIPGGNQKRAITVLQSSMAAADSLNSDSAQTHNPFVSHNLPNSLPKEETSLFQPTHRAVESLSLPLLGRVAAGLPIEALDHDETVDVPPSMVRQPQKSFALKVEGQSMIDDGILDGDVILIQRQSYANNGDIVVATVDNEATVKRFYFHTDKKTSTSQIELRPANSDMQPMWFSPDEVDVRGVVVGLLRQF
jgi:repressor LexA